MQNPAVTTVPVQTTATPKSTTTVQTTTITTTTIPEQSEEEKLMEIGRNLPHDGTDYGKALAVYDYMIANGSGICVNYAYRTYCICKGIGLEEYLDDIRSVKSSETKEYFKLSTDNSCRYVEMEDIYYFSYVQDRTINVQMRKDSYAIKDSIANVYDIVNHGFIFTIMK